MEFARAAQKNGGFVEAAILFEMEPD